MNPHIRGDASHAYRDPAALYADGVFHLFFTLVETEEDGGVYMYTAKSVSRDLAHWSEPRKLTVRDRAKNFSSPGNIVRHGGRWLMCLQSYCRENGEKYGSDKSRVFFTESDDLEVWDEPYPVPLKGPDVPIAGCGRMIDPYLVRSDDGLWYCFFKQNGISISTSADLAVWHFAGRVDAGENPSVVRRGEDYYLFHSPANGIAVKRSRDLLHWSDFSPPLTLGQAGWPWARGRLTAGTVLPAPPPFPPYLLFFHGTGPDGESKIFDTHACIGLAWSEDLVNWKY